MTTTPHTTSYHCDRISESRQVFCVPGRRAHRFRLAFDQAIGQQDNQRVLYLQATDNSSGSQSRTRVPLHQRERGGGHGTALVVRPAPLGRSRVPLPRQPCRGACSSQGHRFPAPRPPPAAPHPRPSPQALPRAAPPPARRGRGAGRREPPPGAQGPPLLRPCPRGRRRPVAPAPPCGPEPAGAAPGGRGRGHRRAPGPPGGPIRIKLRK
jgi:hypothetical protein